MFMIIKLFMVLMAEEIGDTESISHTLTNTTDNINADNVLFSNIITQVIFGITLGGLFLFCRKRAPYVYYPNSLKRPHHPCYKYTGLFNWFVPVINLDDAKLLGMVGLDGFMLLQTLKLLYRAFFILSIVYCPLLLTIYYTNQKLKKDTLFEKLSIEGIENHIAYYICVILMYLTTIFLFYLLFIYYKRYVTLRQIYLISPASLTSVETLKQLSKQLSTYENSIEFINIASKTVIMTRLPQYLCNDQDVYDYVKELGLNDIVNTVLIQDTYYLTKLYEKRDVILQNIEKEINVAFLRIKNFMKNNHDICLDSFKETYNEDIEVGALKVFRNMRFNIEEKVHLLNNFIQNGNQFLNIAGDNISMLIIYIEQLRYCNQKILEEKERLQKQKEVRCPINFFKKTNQQKFSNKPGNKKEIIYTQTPNVNIVAENLETTGIPIYNKEDDSSESEIQNKVHIHRSQNVMPDVSNTCFVKTDLDESVSFFSFSQLRNLKKYKRYFTLDIPIRKQKAFVTFNDVKQAGLIKQSQIGTRIFSPSANSAPAPHDIIWKNLTRSEISCFFGKLGSTMMFIGYNILFYFAVSTIVKMLKLDGNNYILSKIRKSEMLSTYYNGAITPAVYNLCIAISPFILDSLINLEGIVSYSTSQIRLMKWYSIFLFYNAFLSIFFSTSFFNMLNNIFKNNHSKLDTFLRDLGRGYSEYSLFFMNTVIQRLISGSLMTLLKPGPFFINFVIYNFYKRTRRQEHELHMSAPFDFGNVIPMVLLIFPITLSYGCVNPIMLILGWLYYIINYFVYKSELIYSQRNSYESGGTFWIETSMFIVLGVISFQISTVANLFSEGINNITLIILPLLIIDYYFYYALKSLFNRNVNNYPLNEPEEQFLDEFSNKFIVERKKMLENWEETEEHDDEDLFPITELGLHDRNIITNTSHYKDPSTALNISHIMLPKNFYICIHYLKTFDFKNVFGFNAKRSI